MTFLMTRIILKRRYKFRLCATILLFAIFCLCQVYSELHFEKLPGINRGIQADIEESLKEDKGTGCDIPKLDPFDLDIMAFEKTSPPIQCNGLDWVKCYMSTCKVNPLVLKSVMNLKCSYKDILYQSDFEYKLGDYHKVYKGDHKFKFILSDHVRIYCKAEPSNRSFPTSWTGIASGYRPIKPKTPPPGREKTYNVLIFGFDSTSKNHFIRKMPKAYKMLKEEIKPVILNGYNVVGDGTPASLFPILTGKTELELPECRRSIKGSGYLDSMPFIFYKLKKDGYRTLYYEDMPAIGTFQYRFNGFKQQPADHYLRDFFLEAYNYRKEINVDGYCVGDTPSHRLMMNLTDQFFQLDGKKYAFTFIAGVTHDDANRISQAEDATIDFLRGLINKGVFKDTLFIMMGDHGARYANFRQTLQGKLEERLPLMAIRLPDDFVTNRPDAQSALEINADVLTTPHDIYATVLDVLDLTKHWNQYKVKGADLPRGLTLLDPIPKNRSCSEAGIERHWCACLKWEPVAATHPLYNRTARALVDKINAMTSFVDKLCARRSLTSVSWVMRKRPNARVLSFQKAKDADGYIGQFGSAPVPPTHRDVYQIQIEVGPGSGVFEAAVTHHRKTDALTINPREISRVNRYNNEPICISSKYPHLNSYCYCTEMTFLMTRIILKRRYKFRLCATILLFAIFCLCQVYSEVHYENLPGINSGIQSDIEESLKEDKGTGCDIPKLDPFDPELMAFEKTSSPIQCKGLDWVKCYMSTCKVNPLVLKSVMNLKCRYRDILYKSDFEYKLSDYYKVYKGDHEFKFNLSDHVRIYCKAEPSNRRFPTTWKGIASGYRPIKPKTPPPGREKTYNVLIFGFDSTSKNLFIRKMPKAYKLLKEEIKAVIMNGYNVVGDGTPAALFPILTGKIESEMPDCRRSMEGSVHLDSLPFIFYKLKEDGYRTLYYEDSPTIGTFTYRLNGFKQQPADHYLRDFFLEAKNRDGHCVGDTPSHRLMMNLTDQFFQLDGRKYAFTFIVDVAHDDVNRISQAEDATIDFLRGLINKGVFKDTLFIMMGDHGVRYTNYRQTLQGKLEERLPLMAIRLPDDFVKNKPNAQSALEINADVLTTPHDIYATVLDVLDLRKHWNQFKVKGADLPRGLTLLDPIPKNRSCSEAGIERHWCACLKWEPVAATHPLYNRTARALVDKINNMTSIVNKLCARRSLTSVSWVTLKRPNARALAYQRAKDTDGFIGEFGSASVPPPQRDVYQIQIEVGPGSGVFEATVTHHSKTDALTINPTEISRVNRYNNEPSCISAKYPHLNPYCYCTEVH